jgi:hypothetical protein
VPKIIVVLTSLLYSPKRCIQIVAFMIVNTGLGSYINERLKYLYYSRVNFRIFKSRKIKLSRLSISMGGREKCKKHFNQIPKRRGYFGNIGVRRRIILKWVLRNTYSESGSGSYCLGIGSCG